MSEIIKPVAQAIAQVAESLGLSPTVKGVVWAPRMLDRLPALVIEVPAGARTDPDQAESQLYTRDWNLDYACTFYTDLADAVTAQDRLTDLIEAFVMAVDADETLGGLANSAKVVEWDQPAELELEGSTRSLLMLKSTVAVQLFV